MVTWLPEGKNGFNHSNYKGLNVNRIEVTLAAKWLQKVTWREYMHEKIVDIQNAFWKAYKEFLANRDVRQYEKTINTLFEKYRNDDLMAQFCEGLISTWAPIIYGRR